MTEFVSFAITLSDCFPVLNSFQSLVLKNTIDSFHTIRLFIVQSKTD